MKPRSLRAELTRASLLTTLVALLLSAGAILLYELATYRSGLVADLKTQADILAHSTAAALVFNDAKAAKESLALLSLKPTVRAAAIYGRNGDAFASYAVDSDDSSPARAEASLGRNGTRFERTEMEVTYPVVDAGEQIGTVYLRARHDIRGRAIGYAVILAAATLASLLLAYFVFGRLQRKVTAPLLEMTEVARQVMQRRDWQLRAPASANRDLGVLVDAFNGMLAEVESRTGELERESTERRLAEESLRLADRRKDEFLATLAHELRNPLAPMTNAVALVRAPAAAAETRERAIAILERQLRHIVRLIDDLLDVSRVATGKLSLQLERTDIATVLRGAVELAESATQQRQQTLGLAMPSEPCWADGDPARLAQVFANLLSNATRYTGTGGRIDVAMRTEDGWSQVDIRDSGAGIAVEMQQRIFELFEQVDKSLERGNTGLGIGLTLARQLVRLHGGDITVHSEGLGHGACFMVRLPRLAADAVAGLSSAPAPPPAASAPARLRILIADDNRDYATTLAELLATMGHDVAIVHEGRAALPAAMARVPDVALVDIGMPGLNGYEVARLIRAEPSTAAAMLVAVTGWGQVADKEAAARAGFDHHLVKPAAPEQLVALLGRASVHH